MSDSVWSPAAAGARLQAARTERGLDLGVLAAQLKVPAARLEALEAGRWQELPDGPYARGLAKAVCRVLQIEAEPVLQAMPGAAPNALERVTVGLNQPFREGGAQPGWSRWVGLALAVVAALLAAALWLWPDAGWRTLAADAAMAPPPAAPGVVVTAPSIDAVPGPANDGAASAPAVAASTAVSPVNAAPAENTVAAEPLPMAAPTAAPAAALLRIQVQEATWVSVIDGKGQRMASRLLQPGELLALDPEAMPVRVTLGNAPGVRLVWRGKDQDLSAYAQSRVARLELP